MGEHPKVFISYSYDTPEHKQWVSELGAKLRRKGVEVILDQWHLRLGDDLGTIHGAWHQRLRQGAGHLHRQLREKGERR